MDKEFEERLCHEFFDKRVRDRLAYELGSAKKRGELLRKLSHTAEDYIRQSAVISRFEAPPERETIYDFLKSTNCTEAGFTSDCYFCDHKCKTKGYGKNQVYKDED
ncbi:MAG: hypothetical protein J6K92_09065, partial [Oscillospiraceae bacterium]|nr:hypothetical protein [Oscillospiraceae bacterium]